ncbi:MAG: carbohydrate ABC transporter permease, partial [Janthinobacterium lividum]
NTLLYAGVGSVASVAISAAAGYALAKYRFAGREALFRMILAGVLVPQITLAIPQYLLLAKLGLVGSYWSVLLPSVISPYGIYLCRIYAAAAVPNEMLEAGRIDGAGEAKLFRYVGLPPMLPGLVTVLLLQFIAIWNNFLLPFIMLSDNSKYPMTVGLFSLLNQGASQPALYTLVIAGAMLSILPLIALFLLLQRFWNMDMLSGGLKG